MATNLFLWTQKECVEVKTEIPNSIIRVTSIENQVYFLTATNDLYHGEIFNVNSDLPSLKLNCIDFIKAIDIDSCNNYLYIVNLEGYVQKYNANLELINDIVLNEDLLCSKGHLAKTSRVKVAKIATGEFGQLFVTQFDHLWASGCMPQIGINSEVPKRVNFFVGRCIHSINIGYDFAIVVSKSKYFDIDYHDVFNTNCPQCCLASSGSQTSLSDISPSDLKFLGSYDIETTSTSSKNETSISSNESKEIRGDDKHQDKVDLSEKSILLRNTEAAKEYLTKQLFRMSSAGEEYLVECTEKPTRIIKENVTNVASLVYEGVKTVGDKVVTLSRHVSGSSECNSIVEDKNLQIPKITSKDDFMCSLSQCTSEKDFSEQYINNKVQSLLKQGSEFLNQEIWTWGNVGHGQLGMGDKIKRERPMIITKLSNIGIQKVSVQTYHAAALTLDGRVFIWGRNDCNQVTSANNDDQSSPKLFNPTIHEKFRDVVCGKNFTALLNHQKELIYFGKDTLKPISLYSSNKNGSNSHVEINTNLLSSMNFTLMNAAGTRKKIVSVFLVEYQNFLEEMLTVHTGLIKPLLKKSNNTLDSILSEELYEKYIDVLHLTAVTVHSLLEYENNLIPSFDITVVKNLEEYIIVFTEYVQVLCNVISVQGFHHILHLVEVSQSLCKLRPDIVTKSGKYRNDLMVSLLSLEFVKNLVCYVRLIEKLNSDDNLNMDDAATKLTGFIEEQERKLKDAETTMEFWTNSGRNLEVLKEPHRRLIRDSHKSPISLLSAGRFSSHWFILFSDIFVHVSSSTPHVHDLSTIWLEPQQDESSRQHQICLKMPEESIVIFANEAEVKIEWIHAMQSAIKKHLGKSDALKPPTVRRCSYTFLKNGFFKNATYSGRWSNAKMHGKGMLKWIDGKTYTGHFVNGFLCGYGEMYIPNIGTYAGQWKNNLQNGYGTLIYTNSDIYKGHFKDGQPHGHGFLRTGSFMANSASFYIGDWFMGMKNGYGVLDDIVSGNKYIGNWCDDKKQGKGMILTSDGVYYEGIFSQDTLTGHGIMVLEDGIYYEGEFKGTGILSGKGTLNLPSGHRIEGILSGCPDEGIKITNGTLIKNGDANLPKSFETLCAPVDEKWKSLFKHCYQLLGISENQINNDNKNAKGNDTQTIWQNVAIVLSNASNAIREKSIENDKFQNTLNDLDIIPPFGRKFLDLDTYMDVQNYLKKAFESLYHPLGSLLVDLTEAYNTTYGGRAHPLLLPHAISELHYITRKCYEIVRHLFPALPVYDKATLIENEISEDVINYQSLLYPLILPKIHHPLFTLFTLKNEQQERKYKKTLMEWNKLSDLTLMAFLTVDQKFFKNTSHFSGSPAKHKLFIEAIETLQQLKSCFSPTEKLIIIRDTVAKMTPVVQQMLTMNSYVWNMDDLFPTFLYVVVRARIPDLGSELDFIENFMDSALESGELGIMFTTLQACYQQILQEKTSTF